MTWQRVWVTPGAITLPPYLFDQQREACLTCGHIDRAMGETMFCNAVSVGCSQARLPGEPCGPDAALRTVGAPDAPRPESNMGRFLAALQGSERKTVAQLSAATGMSAEHVNAIARRALAEKRVMRFLAHRGYAYSLPRTEVTE